MADTITVAVDGDDTFVFGANSYTNPTKLTPGEYVMGMNIINRGGIAQTRPGSRSLLDIPSGNLQGLKLFKPASGIPHLVFAVDGAIYVSAYPFESYARLSNIQFSPSSKYVSWAVCLQSTTYTADGVITFLPNPISVLMMQDGVTRAAYWDGSSSGHIDPTPSETDITMVGRDGTPVGLWMAWSNNRLWVSRGGQIFASDIGNPLKFADARYLNEGRAFYLPDDCTGITETSDQQGIICFTQNAGVFLRSSIQDRTQWLTTAGFQQTILPSIGCVSPRSIVQQYGIIWWYSSKGLINFDDALRLNVTSRLTIQDTEMAASKAYLSYDLSGVCGGINENFLFHAVPYGDSVNTRIHVLDQESFEGSANSWPSYWTGWRPVEFATGTINSYDRVFTISKDYDGVNRIWELFRSEKNDNGIPITCYIQTRPLFFNNRDYKRFKYAEIELCNIVGSVAIKVAAAGLRGGYQTICTKDIVSTVGQIYSDSLYGTNEHTIYGSLPQTRIILTDDMPGPSDCNSECIESDRRGLIDKAFSLAIVWSGELGVSAYRMFSLFEPVAYQGTCEDDETGETRLINPQGCGSVEKFNTEEAFNKYYASYTFNATNEAGESSAKNSIQSSVINQQDADRKAIATAKWYVYSALGYET